MKQVSTTPEGLIVVDGVFKLYDTHGLPLDIIIAGLHERGTIPCWLTLFRDALGAGWKAARTLLWIESAVRDSLHPLAEGIIERVKMLPEYIVARAKIAKQIYLDIEAEALLQPLHAKQ